MIKQKRGKLISRIIFLALVAVIILFGFLVISNLQLFSSEDGFTGAAISITPNEELNQVSEQIELIDDNSTVNGNESLTETNLISQGTLGIQVVANATQCGTVNGSITLTADVSATGTCFTINATSVTIDCAGYSINYSTAGTLGYGVDNSVGFDGYESVTIKNCNIYEGNLSTSSKFAIYFLDAGNALIENNNITTIGSASFGIYFWVSSSTNMISNTITTSNNDGIGIKIRSTQSSNFTDNKINTGGSYGGYGISVPSSTSNIFTNNTINTNSLEGYGILFSNSDSNILINNTISTSGTDSYGINMNTGNDFNILTNNTINTNGTSGYGIRFYRSSNSNISSNKFNTTNSPAIFIEEPAKLLSYYNHNIDTTNTEQGKPIYYYFNNDSTVIENLGDIGQLYIVNSTNITVSNLTFDKDGIFVIASTNITIQNSSVFGVPNDGIYLHNLTNGIISDNNISNTGEHGVYLSESNNIQVRRNNLTNNLAGFYISGFDNSFENNSLFNNTIGYKLASGNSNFVLERVINHSIAILVNSTIDTYNNTFRDCGFANNSLDLSMTRGPDNNITLINCSINKSKLYVDFGRAYIKWYVDANVTDSLQNTLANATVIAYNSLGNVEDTYLTNSNGIARLSVTEFYRESETNFYLTPSTIKASKDNYTENSTSINLYDQTYLSTNISLTEFTCGSTISTNINLGNNFVCGNSGLVIGTDNITIDGNNYNLTGNGSGIGIDLNGKSSINIINLQISNFSSGINILNTDNSSLTNLVITNNFYGLIFNNSNNNVVYDSIFANNSAYSVYATNTGETINSLVNYTGDLNNITVNGTAQVFLKWYVDVNASYYDADNNFASLPNANASGLFNNTGVLEHSLLTNSNGQARLILSELKKNASGTFYLTPHNISILYTLSSGTRINSTSINLTQTNNTGVNLSLVLDCISPSGTMNISADTLFCPGTFDVDGITIGSNDVELTCDNTVLKGLASSTSGFRIYNRDNVKIVGCSLLDYVYGISIYSSNLSISNVSITSIAYRAIDCFYSQNLIVNNSYLLSDILVTEEGEVPTHAIRLVSCDNALIFDNIFEGYYGILTKNSKNGTFINNTFNELTKAIEFSSYPASNNNTFYHNTFTDNTYNYYYFNSTLYPYNNTFNTSVAGYAQGNEYSDYCDKGVDNNNDGYADADSSTTTDDWPYSENISSKVYDPTDNNEGVIDYGPKIITCPAGEVTLGSTTTSSSTTETDSGSAPAVAVAPSVAEAAVVSGAAYTDPDAVRDNLRSRLADFDFDERLTRVTVTLENTGNKQMSLFPELFQEIDDPFFVVTRKTLGYQDSFFSKIANLWYSKNIIAGRLLKAELLNPEQIILEPGETIEKTLEIEEGLVIPRQIKIQFTTFGETVLEQEVEVQKKAISGTAVDLDQENNLLDLYVVVVPASAELEEYYAGESNDLTGAAVNEISTDTDNYMLELNINQESSAFTDLYGPYNIPHEQSLVFAQQIEYDTERYSGAHEITTKIYRNGKVIVDDEFAVDLGQGGESDRISTYWLLLLVLLFIGFIIFTLCLVREGKRKVDYFVKKEEIVKKEVAETKTRKLKLSPEKTLELINFINECRELNYSNNEISEMLIKNGWQKSIVKKLLGK